MVRRRLQPYNLFRTVILRNNPNSTSDQLCGLLFSLRKLPKGCESGIFGGNVLCFWAPPPGNGLICHFASYTLPPYRTCEQSFLESLVGGWGDRMQIATSPYKPLFPHLKTRESLVCNRQWIKGIIFLYPIFSEIPCIPLHMITNVLSVFCYDIKVKYRSLYFLGYTASYLADHS